MRALRIVVLLAAVALTAACGSKFRHYDGPEVTQIYVRKADRKMYLLHGNVALKTYDIALGGNPVGAKQYEGDMKTPEGVYYIDRRNPNSTYHLSLGISYPNNADRENAAAMGKRPGGDIFIHGRAGANKGKGRDWTAGCIAVKDGQMEEVYSMIRPGTPILIVP